MSDDWQVGDLAQYVGPDDGEIESGWDPQFLAIYTVCYVHLDGNLELEQDPEKFHPLGSWAPYRFRKIRPHTPDAEDAETIALLTGAPVRERAA